MSRTRQRNRRKRAPLLAKNPCHLLSKMHRIAQAAAIAGNQQLIALFKTLCNPLTDLLDKRDTPLFTQKAHSAHRIIDSLYNFITHTPTSLKSNTNAPALNFSILCGE